MTALPHMALYISDFKSATRHLSLAERGIYMDLLMLCWETPGCKLPNDIQWIKRHMVGVSEEEWTAAAEPVLQEFFTTTKKHIFQKRQLRDWTKINSVLRAKKAAGKRGGKAKALKRRQNDDAFATNLPLAKQDISHSTRARSISIPISILDNQYLETNGKGHSNGKDHSDAQNVMMIGTHVLELAGIDPEQWNGNFNSVRSWLAAGYTAEHIYPAVKSVASQSTYNASSIASLAYFSKAVERKHQAVKAEQDPTKGWTGQDVKNYLEHYRASGKVFWPQWAGPKPGLPGFRWPDQLIDADLE